MTRKTLKEPLTFGAIRKARKLGLTTFWYDGELYQPFHEGVYGVCEILTLSMLGVPYQQVVLMYYQWWDGEKWWARSKTPDQAYVAYCHKIPTIHPTPTFCGLRSKAK